MSEHITTPMQMRNWEKAFIESGVNSLILMENAAKNASEVIQSYESPCDVTIFCGGGNNGGDGIAMARHLLINGFKPSIVLLNKEGLTSDAKTNLVMASCLNIPILGRQDFTSLPYADFYIDAIFGTGLSKEVEGVYKNAVDVMNNSGKRVYAVDVPSGIDALGNVLGCALKAFATITFQFVKTSHLLFPGREYAGNLHVVDIGIPVLNTKGLHRRHTRQDIERMLPARDADTNKGSYGKALIIAGSSEMSGAAGICAESALRSGCGLATLCVPKSILNTCHIMIKEAIVKPLPDDGGMLAEKDTQEIIAGYANSHSAAAIGPGLGMAAGVGCALEQLIGAIPLVIDADGLNVLARDFSLLKQSNGQVVLTPHAKEMERLCGKSVDEIKKDPMTAALEFAKKHNVVVVLKDATTVIASPDGKLTFNTTGGPMLAKGGSGDVLTGIIVSLMAQGVCAYDAASLGSYILGLAGEEAVRAKGMRSVLASDVIGCIGRII
jgi:hydroxyethylthiazole kinase-like uncharacterized protein yjeF